MSELERAYRVVERRREVPLETRVFRGKVGVLLALQLSLLLASVTFAVDLRRLGTPVGTAQAWAEATVFGDCDRARELSVAGPGGPSDAALCGRVERRAAARAEALGGVQVRTELVDAAGGRARVRALLTEGTRTTSTVLPLVQEDGAWRVVRTAEACRLGC